MDVRVAAVPLLCLLNVYETQPATEILIQPINKLVNSSVTFTMGPAECAPEDTTIRWKSKGKYQEIGLCRNHSFEAIVPRFLNRTDCNGDTRVTIRNLSQADSGLYILSYTLPCKLKKHITYYNLTVYEPVPAPHIEKEVERNSACCCNFTLYCSVPTNSSVEWYHWQKGNNETGHLHYMNGSSIQVSLHSQSLRTLDEEFSCTVYNPANQKSTSIHIKDICTLMTDRELQRYYLWFIPLFLIILIALLVCLAVARKKRKRYQHVY
eukprot:XP_004917392.1 PREDICTED: SLAM family member 9-like [Xenopus tropicalis]